MAGAPPDAEGRAGKADRRPEEGAEGARAKPRKAPSAFRTISEVADDLHIPQHVLRFWETKFPQVKPLKRGGGRRYYRPEDIALLRRISGLLYVQGYTIKGVQRLLREGGGKLADDIPPPSPEDAEPEVPAPVAQTELPIPGLTPPSPRAAPRPARAGDAPSEAERLRLVLLETLRSLEDLRALLD